MRPAMVPDTTRGSVLQSISRLITPGLTPNSYTATDHTATKLAAVPARLTNSPAITSRKSRDERSASSTSASVGPASRHPRRRLSEAPRFGGVALLALSCCGETEGSDEATRPAPRPSDDAPKALDHRAAAGGARSTPRPSGRRCLGRHAPGRRRALGARHLRRYDRSRRASTPGGHFGRVR